MPRIEFDEPHEAQEQCLREARRFNVLECGRRWGKTALLMRVLIEPAIAGYPVGWFAPTYKYLAEQWREIEFTCRPLISRIDKQERRIELLGNGVIDFWSMDTPDPGRGRKYRRVVCDEASIVRNFRSIWDAAIRPTLTDFKGDAWFAFTPKGYRGAHELWALGQGGDPEWKSWRFGSVSNPYIDPAEVESARRSMPEAVFNQEYLGIPAEDGGNPFGIAAIARCVSDDLDAEHYPPAAWGVDLARSVDWTAIVGLSADGRAVVVDRWQSDWAQTMRRVRDRIGDDPAAVDETGVGSPIVEQLGRECCMVEGVTFTSVRKQQLMEGLAAAIQQGKIRIPDGWLRSELESFEYQYRAGGVRYSAPDGMHDDGVCALALALYKLQQGVTGPVAFSVSKSDSVDMALMGDAGWTQLGQW